jgi:hypothetical protein
LKLNSKGLITHVLLDDLGISTQGLTSVKEYQNALYLGSLRNQFSGYLDLSMVPEYRPTISEGLSTTFVSDDLQFK